MGIKQFGSEQTSALGSIARTWKMEPKNPPSTGGEQSFCQVNIYVLHHTCLVKSSAQAINIRSDIPPEGRLHTRVEAQHTVRPNDCAHDVHRARKRTLLVLQPIS